jgi:RES domain-containing protein
MIQQPHPHYNQLVEAMRRAIPSAISWSGTVYRSVSPDFDRPSTVLSGEGARIVGARYTPRGEFATLYTSLDPETAMSEAVQRLRDYGISVTIAFPRVFHAIEVELSSVLDLTKPAIRRAMKFTKASLVAENWRDCREGHRETLTQAVGRAAWNLQFGALLVPSARHRHGRNLVIFPDHVAEGRIRVRRQRRK